MRRMISLAIAILIAVGLMPLRTAVAAPDSTVYIYYSSLNKVANAWGYTLGLVTNEEGAHVAFFTSLIGDEKSKSWKVEVDNTAGDSVLGIDQQSLHDAIAWLATPCPGTASQPCNPRTNKVVEIGYGDLDAMIRTFGYSIGAWGPEDAVRISGTSIPVSNATSPRWLLLSSDGKAHGWVMDQRTVRIMLSWFVNHDNSPKK